MHLKFHQICCKLHFIYRKFHLTGFQNFKKRSWMCNCPRQLSQGQKKEKSDIKLQIALLCTGFIFFMLILVVMPLASCCDNKVNIPWTLQVNLYQTPTRKITSYFTAMQYIVRKNKLTSTIGEAAMCDIRLISWANENLCQKFTSPHYYLPLLFLLWCWCRRRSRIWIQVHWFKPMSRESCAAVSITRFCHDFA